MKVTTEGDDLYYEVRGKGTPLLMIPGGGGAGGAYALVADILSDEYKVITYDRRSCSRSTINFPEHFDVAQQSRDAAAVIKAAGEESAFIFGNSGGAVIALDMAATQAHVVRGVIAHEPPLARVHPDADKWQRFFQSVYRSSFTFGSTFAMMKCAFCVGLDFQFFKALQGAQSGSQSCRSELGTVYVQKTPDQIFSPTRTFTCHSLSPRLSGDKEQQYKSYYGRRKEVT